MTLGGVRATMIPFVR